MTTLPKYRFKGHATLLLDPDNQIDSRTFAHFEIKKLLPFQPMADYNYSFVVFPIGFEMREYSKLWWDEDTQTFTHYRRYAYESASGLYDDIAICREQGWNSTNCVIDGKSASLDDLLALLSKFSKQELDSMA